MTDIRFGIAGATREQVKELLGEFATPDLALSSPEVKRAFGVEQEAVAQLLNAAGWASFKALIVYATSKGLRLILDAQARKKMASSYVKFELGASGNPQVRVEARDFTEFEIDKDGDRLTFRITSNGEVK